MSVTPPTSRADAPVDRHVHGTSFEGAQHACHRVDRLGEEQAYAITSFDTTIAKEVSQSVGHRLQLGVGQALTPSRNRHPIGPTHRTLTAELLQEIRHVRLLSLHRAPGPSHYKPRKPAMMTFWISDVPE